MIKVLVADDERWIRKGIVRMIDRERNPIGEIWEAENVTQALEIFRREMPEIILSDVMFPQENGCDLGERIFEMNPNAKIVMISVYDDFDNARRALRFRAVDYLLKPVSREQLNLILDQCVQQIETERQQAEGEKAGADVLEERLAVLAEDNSSSRIVEKLMRDIREDCARHYTLSQLAEECHVTESYFSSLFKKVSGKSLMSYLAQVRVEKAQELIASTEYKLVQIAEAVGYDDYQYFTKVFKKISGVTPGEYKAGIAREIEDEDGTDT